MADQTVTTPDRQAAADIAAHVNDYSHFVRGIRWLGAAWLLLIATLIMTVTQ